MAKDNREVTRGILGDIHRVPMGHSAGVANDEAREEDKDEKDEQKNEGAREVTGKLGGTGPEVGGTRNYRQGSGATGGDIGNRPE